MRSIDLHSHVIPPTLVDAIRRDPTRFGGAKIEERDGKLHYSSHGWSSELFPSFYDADAKIEWMDSVRLDISAISVGPPTYYYWLSPEAGLAAARLSNDGIAQMVAKYPARLRGMATLPMQDPDAAIVELERAVKAYGFKAVELGTSIDGISLADPKFRKVLKTIEQLGCFVFAHPYKCMAHGGMEGYYMGNIIGFPLDTTLMIGQFMLSGALEDLKSLRILCPHGGGFVPYQFGRFVHVHKVRPEARTSTTTSPADLLRRFYFDAMTLDPRAARHLIDMVGADRVVIGTDHPFDTGPTEPVADIDAIPGLTASEREWVCSKSALSLLGET
jgi:aminocarboxymuconate-semialdehyde decarboxylase